MPLHEQLLLTLAISTGFLFLPSPSAQAFEIGPIVKSFLVEVTNQATDYLNQEIQEEWDNLIPDPPQDPYPGSIPPEFTLPPAPQEQPIFFKQQPTQIEQDP